VIPGESAVETPVKLTDENNEIVEDTYEILKEKYDSAELVVKKNGSEEKLGDLLVDRRYYDGQSGAPDLLIDIRNFSMLGADFPGKFPRSLIEVETTVSGAIPDLESYADQDGHSSPVLIITDSERATRRKNIKGTHRFRIRGLPFNKMRVS
jgi:hypothetical protein